MSELSIDQTRLFTICSICEMEVCTIWWMIMCFLSTLKIANASVNTSIYPNVKTTSQSSSRGDASSSVKAVDGCTSQHFPDGCCSHTAAGRLEAWWQIDLQGQVVMEYVKIYYRNTSYQQQQRFGGYQIYQSNTSDWRNGYLCHQDATSTSAALSLIPQIPCTGSTRYLTIYSDRRSGGLSWYSHTAILELCEVEVYGCPLGKFGNGNCDSDCDTVCANSLCDPVTGECAYCEDGYFGPLCDACSIGCTSPVCDKISGGCSQCDSGFHGSICDKTCPINCKDNICVQDSGACPDCVVGFHGSTCTQMCPINCKDNICSKTNGFCAECVPGVYGSTCDQTCATNCKDNTCIQGNGFCMECDVGYHGSQCDRNCPSNCRGNLCNQTTGRCTGCESEYHGSDCSEICPDNCKDNICVQENGRCAGCVPGYHGDHCDKACHSNCNNDICDQQDNACFECVSGFHGSRCLDKCGYCQDGSCDKATGNCMTPCVDGLTGDRCDIRVVHIQSKEYGFNAAAIGICSACGAVILALVIVIIVLARRQQARTHHDTARSTTMTDISLPSIGQERRIETDETYDVIDSHNREQRTTKTTQNDGNYEHLGHRERAVPHIYETTCSSRPEKYLQKNI